MGTKLLISSSIFLLLTVSIAKSQDSIAFYSIYQITSAWHLTQSDTTDISEKFDDDYYFAFFVEDIEGKQFFTIKNFEGDETMCIGSIQYDFSETEGESNVDFYSSEVYCNPEQENPANSIMMEYIPQSEVETGYKFYYLWVILSQDDALLFLCFDATNIGEEADEESESTDL